MVAVAIASIAVLVYTYFGYPALIVLLARARPLRVRRDPGYTPGVSVIIPAYNARQYVAAKLESLLALDYPRNRLQILVCSDASDDGTDDEVARFADRDDRVVLLRADTRSGKPSAVNRMRAQATGEVLLMTDIRQPLAPAALRELVSRLADPEVGAVSGNLVLRGRAGAGVYWRYENAIREAEGRFRSMVGVTGPIYAVRAVDMGEMPAEIILDDMWVPMRLRLGGKRIVFAPRAEAYDEAFEDEREFGRKVRTLAGNYQLFARLPQLLIPVVNPSWFETVSHKIMRLVCPWALLALLAVTAVVLARPPAEMGDRTLTLFWALGIGQAGFYSLSLLGARLGRFGALCRTFVVLNVAALVGLWRFLRSSQKVTW